MKQLLGKYIIYLLLKYVAYYFWQFGTTLGDLNFTDFETIVFGIILLSILPMVELLLLATPTVFFVEKIQSNKIWIISLGPVFCAEFAMTVWMTQSHIEYHQIVKIIISAIFFLLVFRRELTRTNERKTAHNNT